MKLVSRVLSSIDGAEVYAVIAMLLFFAIFLAVGVWLLRVRKGYFKEVSMLPLEEDDLEVNHNQPSNQ